ncbi:MAG TPA: ATP-binding protein [Longimicrobiales bacterium]
MKVATRLSGAFGVLVAILVGLLIYHVRTTRDAVATSYELSGISARLYLSATKQIARLGQLEEAASKYGVTRDRGYLDKFDQALDAFDADLRYLASLPLAGRERDELTRLARLWAAFLPVAHRLRPLVLRATDAPAADSLAFLHQQLDRLRAQARRVSDASQAVMTARIGDSAEAARHAERLSWIAAAVALVLSVLVATWIVRSISEALNRLKEGTRQVADGNFAYRLEPRRNDEFAQLARDFNVMTRRLGELDEMKRDFLSKVSHDLKTPLASMQETIRLLLDEVPGPLTDRQRRLLELNLQSGDRLFGMISKLLDLSGMEAGALTLDFDDHEIGALVRLALERLEPRAKESGLRLAADIREPELPARCDAERIAQVLDNLLENAIEFSPEGTIIRVAVHACTSRPREVPVSRWQMVRRADGAGAILIAVADSGPGIPDAEKERVFERFFQSETGRRARGRGVGLGLTICREIVGAHGGAIWVADHPGGGSIFYLLLPGAPRRVPTAEPALVHHAPPAMNA